MISFVRGELAEIGDGTVVVDTGGVGYEIYVPASVIGSLPPAGCTVKLHTWFQVREDGMALFGFLTRDDLDVFKLLLRVNGVGPKVAMGVLSAMTPDEFRFAVLAEDDKTICRAPGMGKKTAQKVILELKDKLDPAEVFASRGEAASVASAAPGAADPRNDAAQALTALGYSAADAFRAVNAVELTDGMDTESLLKAALKVLF